MTKLGRLSSIAGTITLERLTNVVTLIAALALVVHIVQVQYASRAAAPSSAAPMGVGDVVADTAGLGFKSGRRTLVIATASTCAYCTASMAYYKRLVSVARDADVRVVGVTRESTQTNREYLLAHEVRLDAVVDAATNRVLYRGTPTLLLFDDDGRILATWLGRLNPTQEEEVIARLLS